MNQYFRITFKEVPYDSFDSFVVCAESAAEAISLLEKEHPKNDTDYCDVKWGGGFEVEQLDREKGIILSSFNAG